MDDAADVALYATPIAQPREVLEQELLSRVAPTLPDGTRLDELIDLRRREVQLRVFDDPHLHRLEMDRIWARCWIPVCHESELPNVGDYKRGYLGEDSVIITRAADRSINVILNVCSHRAMEVCWSDEGNTKRFRCPRHGWIFDLKGELVGAPFEEEEYGAWDKSRFALRKAKMAERHGVHFATFSDDPPSLEDYLTEFVGFFDLMFGSHEMVSIGQAINDISQTNVAANWKILAEANTGDGYHRPSLHRSLYEQGITLHNDATGWLLPSFDTSSTGGHGMRVVEPKSSLGDLPPDDRAFPINWYIDGSLFPNTFVGMNAFTAKTKSGKRVVIHAAWLSTRAPKGPTAGIGAGLHVSLVNREVYDLLVSGELVVSSVGDPLDFRGSGGNDDPEAWLSTQRIASGAVTRRETFKYNTLQGATAAPELPDGLGIVHKGISKDDNQWHFWLAYYDWMTRP
jgi:phenylpropionate dioxygenase-like ring-hydroxylating dioxygenase large terminal subunit